MDGVGFGAIATDDPVVAEPPNVVLSRDWDWLWLRNIVLAALASVDRKIEHALERLGIEANESDVEAFSAKLTELQSEQILIPPTVLSELVVRDRIGALL